MYHRFDQAGSVRTFEGLIPLVPNEIGTDGRICTLTILGSRPSGLSIAPTPAFEIGVLAQTRTG